VQDIIDVKKPEKQPASSKQKLAVLKKASVMPWLLLMLVLASGLAGTMYYKNRAEKVEADPTIAQKEKNDAETDRVLAGLKKILFIGETDKPTVARIEDPEKLKSSNATFYKDVLKGDYLVIYPKRAIIYRESNNQIMNIAPIINTSELEQKQKEQETQPKAETTTNTKKTN
jgi:hypothetical protein